MTKYFASLIAVSLLFGVLPTARAQLYWDINGTNTGATDDGGGNAAGVWDAAPAPINDYNLNGIVDAADYVLWRKSPGDHFGAPGYDQWKTNFGATGTGGTANWSTDPDGNAATIGWIPGEAAVFAAGTNAFGTYTVTLSGPQSASSLTFEDTANVTISGDATTPLTLTSGTANINVVGPSTQLATIDAVISGTDLEKVGDGTLILGGSNMTTNSLTNTYTGNTIITSAVPPSTSTIQLNSSDVIPDTSVIVLQGTGGSGGNNAVLQMNGMNDTVRSISGTYGYIDVGVGTLTINDQAGDSYTLGNYGSSAHLVAQDGGKVIKNGSGTLELAGDTGTAFAGEFILNDGTLLLSRNQAVGAGGSTSRLTIKGGQLGRSHTPTGNFTYSVSNVDLYVFRYDLSDAPVRTSQFSAGTVTTLKADDVEMNITNDPTGTGMFNFAGVIQNNDLLETTPPDRGITKTGNGILSLNGANTYKGPTTIRDGTLRVPATGTIGDDTGATAAALNFSADSGTTATLTVNATRPTPFRNPINVTTGDNYITHLSTTANITAGVQVEFSGPLTGTGGTLSFRNDNTGACAVGNHCVFEPTFTGDGFDFGQPMTIFGPQGPNLNKETELRGGNTSGVQEFSGDISGGGSFRRVNASGTTILSGNNTYTGDTSVDAGTLSIAHPYLADAADVFLTSGAILDLDFSGTDTIDQLFFDNVSQLTGTWGSTSSPATHQDDTFFSGTGMLLVSTPGSGSGSGLSNATTVPEPGALSLMILMLGSGLMTSNRRCRRRKS